VIIFTLANTHGQITLLEYVNRVDAGIDTVNALQTIAGGKDLRSRVLYKTEKIDVNLEQG
jgi:hypothetical protein